MVVLSPLHDADQSQDPELFAGGADRSQEVSEAGDQEMQDQDSVKIARRPSSLSTLKKLQLREIGMPASFSRERFSRIKNVVILDMYMHRNIAGLQQLESFMQNRSAIVKIVPIKDIIVLLSRAGVFTNDLVGFVTRTGEMTEDVFYNKKTKSLIVSSSRRNDNYTEKHYRSISLGMLRRQDNTGYSILTAEHIKWFLVFDDVNEKALMRDGINYKIFDLNTYSMMYKIPEISVADVLCRPRALLFVKENRNNILPLLINCIESGEEICSIYHPTQGRPEFLEMFHEKILIKEKSKGLKIIDVKKSEKKEVPIGFFKYHALFGRNSFFTFQDDSTQLRSLNGTVIKELDGTLWNSRSIEHRIVSTADDDTVIYLANSEASKLGSVNICSLGQDVSVTKFDPEVKVAYLSYNEDLNEIYAGTSGGRVYVYSA